MEPVNSKKFGFLWDLPCDRFLKSVHVYDILKMVVVNQALHLIIRHLRHVLVTQDCH